jgi:glycosyltransferase involved in cell wall biosynthesis
MWDCGDTPTTIIPHGVVVSSDVQWTGDIARGITVVNGLAIRGRLAGGDIFSRVRRDVPLDLAGMGSERENGLGDLAHADLHRREARYRFFFSPIRYTSMPLAVAEAMALGLPIACLATTELPRAITTGREGYISNNLGELIDGMRRLLDDPPMARRMSARSRETAAELFGIQRFQSDWNNAFTRALDGSR